MEMPITAGNLKALQFTTTAYLQRRSARVKTQHHAAALHVMADMARAGCNDRAVAINQLPCGERQAIANGALVAGMDVGRITHVGAILGDQLRSGTAATGLEFLDALAGLADAVTRLGPKNRALLDKRAALQTAIDDWHKARKGQAFDADAYESFLREIG